MASYRGTYKKMNIKISINTSVFIKHTVGIGSTFGIKKKFRIQSIYYDAKGMLQHNINKRSMKKKD